MHVAMLPYGFDNICVLFILVGLFHIVYLLLVDSVMTLLFVLYFLLKYAVQVLQQNNVLYIIGYDL